MLHSLCSSIPSKSTPKALNPDQHLSSSRHAPLYLKFRTQYRENIRYLKAIGVIDPNTKPYKQPLPDATTQILTTINLFKSKGFNDKDFARLAFVCPPLFSEHFEFKEIEPVFTFLIHEIPCSEQEAKGLIMKCPQLLFTNVEYILRPTLDYLKKLGVTRVNVPSNLNAHLLNTRAEKMRSKVTFLRSIGFSKVEAERACARLPAILRYGVESNLRPKFEFLVGEMGRSLEELKQFPQYFAFCLRTRIEPRHLHLKARNVRLKLNRMLMWSDDRFYAKWK